MRAQTADSATARQPAGRAPVGATLDGSNWVCVLSDGKNDDDDDDEDDDSDDIVDDDDNHDDSAGAESAAELPVTPEKLKKPKPG